MIKYPKSIKKKDTIGITATSMGIVDNINKLEKAYENVEMLGYKVVETSNVRTNSKFVSSDGKTRAYEFIKLWKNKNINMISQLVGGEFLMEMLPFIDKDDILSNEPKWVTGYSDSSLLNYYLTTNFNIATVTCSNILSFGMQKPHKSLLKQFEFLEGVDKFVQESYELYEKEKFPRDINIIHPSYNLTDKVEYKNLYDGSNVKIEGRLIGGCIDVIFHLLGTPFDNTVNFCNQFEEGMLWYLENCELQITELYRVLWQMKQAGWFKNANGFIVGRTRSDLSMEDLEYTDVLHKVFDDMNVSVIYDVDFGHVAPQWTMVNGAFASFEYEKGKGKIILEMK